MAGSKKEVKVELSPDEIARLVRLVVDETEREGMVLVAKLVGLGIDKTSKAAVLAEERLRCMCSRK